MKSSHLFTYKGKTFITRKYKSQSKLDEDRKKIKNLYDRYSAEIYIDGPLKGRSENRFRLFADGKICWDVFCRTWSRRKYGRGYESYDMVCLLLLLGVLRLKPVGAWELKISTPCSGPHCVPHIKVRTKGKNYIERKMPCYFSREADARSFVKALYSIDTYPKEMIAWWENDRVEIEQGKYRKHKIYLCYCTKIKRIHL